METNTVPDLASISTTIKALVAEVAGQPPDTIDDATGLDTIGIDSLMVVEVVPFKIIITPVRILLTAQLVEMILKREELYIIWIIHILFSIIPSFGRTNHPRHL